MKIKEAQVKEWLNEVMVGKISFSRMVELINEYKEKPEEVNEDKYINGLYQIPFDQFGMI